MSAAAVIKPIPNNAAMPTVSRESAMSPTSGRQIIDRFNEKTGETVKLDITGKSVGEVNQMISQCSALDHGMFGV